MNEYLVTIDFLSIHRTPDPRTWLYSIVYFARYSGVKTIGEGRPDREVCIIGPSLINNPLPLFLVGAPTGPQLELPLLC